MTWDDAERIRVAQSLGQLLASEEACGLSYDQDAIGAWIDAQVPADDMQFTSMLDMMTDGVGYQLQDMSASQKTAHCRQVARSARAAGFVD